MPDIHDAYEPGLASFETEGPYANEVLFTGDTPVTTTSETAAAAAVSAADLVRYTVVGRDANGDIVPAVKDTIEAIGITTATVLQNATDRRLPVYRAGMFNPRALIWDSSYATDDDKRLAFEASQPTIFIREPVFKNHA